MTAQRWNQIKTTLQAAMELPEDERAAYLDESCGTDEELRREVESLLDTDEERVRFLENPVSQLISNEDQEHLSLEGQQIGPYTLERELGRGGIGSVYLAVRTDEEFERQVAIKILKRGMDTDEIVRRFWAERQILANLNHPNITKLLEGGTTDDGRPYFIMEYIEGVPLDRYCESRRLSVHDQLRLFQKICSAVQFAHRNLVVHRDLKPSNVLVDAEGEPKLLDFGIAKLLNPDLSSPLTVTVEGLRLMTLEYASPEQVNGETITTATDVYTLGAMLFELLAGQRPYAVNRQAPDEARRIITSEIPPRPSTVVSDVLRDAQRRRRALTGDMDTIVLMALRKEPERRYASVEALSEDIERHLQKLPVRARKDTLLYRSGKFIRRNKLGLGIAAAFFLVVVSFGIVTTWQQRQTAKERDRAELISTFLQELFQESNSEKSGTSGKELTALDLLERGADKVTGDLANDPEVQAAVLNVIGSSYESLGAYQQAADFLERALLLRQDHLGEDHFDTLDTTETLAHLYHSMGEYPKAEAMYLDLLAARRRKYGDNHHLVGRTLNNLALTLHEMGRYEEAREYYEKTREIYEEVLDPQDLEVAYTLNNLARTYLQLGELENAEAAFLRVGEIFATQLPRKDVRIATNLASLATLYQRQERFDKAESLLKEALSIRLEVMPPDHPYTGLTHLNLGSNYRRQGNLDDAERHIREALRIFQQSYPDGHKYTGYALDSLGAVFLARGLDDDAERYYREALTIFQMTIPEHPKTRDMTKKLADLLSEHGKEEEAQELQNGLRGSMNPHH